jgi:hypothetical protein
MTNMQHKLSTFGRFTSCVGWIAGMLLVLGSGCDSTGTGNWSQQGGAGSEQWSVNCLRSSAPNHAELCNGLAEYLRKTSGLDPKLVQVQSDGLGSTIYYGRYSRVSGPGGQLVFPPKMQEDMERIRRLTYGQATPFALAAPELRDASTPTGVEEFHVSKAYDTKGKDTMTLLIAVFFNREGFRQRREVAEQYVRQLRGEGVEAYIFHEQVKSYVFVGSFGRDAMVLLPGGAWRFGKEVEDLIKARPGDEFAFLTENGHRQKRMAPDGSFAFAVSQLVRVPRPGATSLYAQ